MASNLYDSGGWQTLGTSHAVQSAVQNKQAYFNNGRRVNNLGMEARNIASQYVYGVNQNQGKQSL